MCAAWHFLQGTMETTNPSKGKCEQVQTASAGDICSDNVLYAQKPSCSADHSHTDISI